MAKKRTAEEGLKTPKAKKTQLSKFGIVPKAIRDIFSPSANSPVEEDDPDESGTPSPEIPAAAPLTALETQRRVAQAIDARFALIEEKRADEALKNPKRLLRWNIEIKPQDDEYLAVRAMFHEELREESVLTVVTNHFEDAQRLLIQPPPRDGIILKIQRQNGEEYRKALAVGGTFEGEKDNLTTKFTMLYFGLPVEAMTLNNILNAGVKDVDDEEDTPDDLPRVQRILFSEKPLQFLDEYHERSCGFPMLRRPKLQTTRMVTQPSKNTSKALSVNPRHGALAKRGGVNLRGGAGPTIPLYGPGTSRSSVPTANLDHETFKDAALDLLGWDKNKPFRFIIDHYNNNEQHKNVKEKPFVRSFTVTNEDTDDNYKYRWDNFLRSRFTNSLMDWALRVVSRAEGEKPEPTYVLPEQDAPYTGNIPQQPATSGGTKPPVTTTTWKPTKAPYKQASRPIYTFGYDQRDVSSASNTDAALFRSHAADLLKRPEIRSLSETDVPWSFKVSFYENPYTNTHITAQAGQPSRKHYKTVTVEKSAYRDIYYQEIQPLLFIKTGGQSGEYLTVVHDTTEEGPELWPIPVVKPPTPPIPVVVKPPTPPVQILKEPTRGSGEGLRPLYTNYPEINAWDLLQVEDHIEAFFRAAQQLLEFNDNEVQWSFFVDLYNRQYSSDQETYTFQSSRRVNTSSLVREFANIRSYLLDTTENWAVAVRSFDQPQQAQARLTNERILVNGYRGQVWTSPNTKSFRRTIYQLLGLNGLMNWSITVDHLADQSKSFNLDSARYDSAVSSQQLQDSFKALAGDAKNMLFIRFATDPRPASWDPWEPWEEGVSNFVVKLERPDVSTAYWKLPSNIKEQHGINQVQGGFRDAMRVLFPPITRSNRPFDDVFSRPRQNIKVDVCDLGFGGMEVTSLLWGRVKKRALQRGKKDRKPLPVKLQLAKNEGDPDMGSEIATGIRLIGSEQFAYAYNNDAAKIYSEIQTLASSYLDPSLPEKVRVWKHASSRESETSAAYNDESITIKLTTDGTEKRTAIDAIRGLLIKGTRRVNCLFFRPEWKDILVSKAPSGTHTWHPEHGKRLHNFRDDVLEELFKGDDILKQNSTKAFWLSIADPIASMKFVVHPSMPDGKVNNEPDDAWRTGIFDWFHSKRIDVALLKSTDGVLKFDFHNTPWGVATETPETLPPTSTTLVKVPPPTVKPAPRYTKINQPRIRASRAAPVKTEKFVKWNAKQRYEDSLQQRSYHTDQSVIEPGQKPQAPIYGMSKELEFNVGASFPGVYVQRITPTDVMEIMDENKSLQNQVLERMASCIICKASFATYKLDEISDHCWRHLQQLYVEGACPTCGNGSWSLWTPEEKRQHQAVHASISDSADVKKFWNQLYCPCCDKELNSIGGPKAILYHMAEHQPGSLQYCDRCGLHMTSCDNYELSHHANQCLDKDDRPPGSTDRWFCDVCGKDRTANTDAEIKEHRRTCGIDNGAWCDTCGLNITYLSNINVGRHKARCKPPGGYDRKFCAKCGENLEIKDTRGLVYHKQTCFNSENSSSLLQYTNGQDPQALSIAVQEERGRLWAKEQDLKYREAVIKNAKDSYEADPQELADTKEMLATTRTQVATQDTKITTLTKQLQNNNVDPPVTEECEFRPRCETDIKPMTRRELVAHFRPHIIAFKLLLTQHDWITTKLTDTENQRQSLATELQTSQADLDKANHALQEANKVLDAAKATGGQDTALTGTCPFPGCAEDLVTLTRQTLLDHFANNHAHTFICNLPEAGQKRCTTLVKYATPEDHLSHLDNWSPPDNTDQEDPLTETLQQALARWLADLKQKCDAHVKNPMNPTRVIIVQQARPRPGETPAAFQARLPTAPVPPVIVENIRKRPGETAIDRDTRVRAANLDWCLDLEAKDYVITNFYPIMADAVLPVDASWDKFIMDAKNTHLDGLRATAGLALPLVHPAGEDITVFGLSSSPMKQPRKVRGTRATSATPATTTKRKRVASATPGPDLAPAPKTPRRAPGRPRRKAVVEEEDEDEFVARDEESEVPLTSPSKRVTRRSPSKRG